MLADARAVGAPLATFFSGFKMGSRGRARVAHVSQAGLTLGGGGWRFFAAKIVEYEADIILECASDIILRECKPPQGEPRRTLHGRECSKKSHHDGRDEIVPIEK